MIRDLSNNDPFLFLDQMIDSTPDESTTEPPAPAPLDAIKQPFQSAEPTMSSLQIADITGKRHDHVLRDIETILEQAEISLPKFGDTYLDGQGKPRPCYRLPRRECDLVISGYSVKYRLAIIDRWQELEKKAADPLTYLSNPDTLRLLLGSYAEKVSELTPKAAGFDRIADSEGSLTITAAAKTLGLAPKALFETLAALKWIYRQGGEWCAFQDKMNAGMMTSKAVTFQASDGDRTTTQARITPKGLSHLSHTLPKP